MKKGTRKLWLYGATVLIVTGVYCFMAPHDNPTFVSYLEKMMYMFGTVAVTVTAEHHSSMQEPVKS